jgi:chaperonin GroES
MNLDVGWIRRVFRRNPPSNISYFGGNYSMAKKLKIRPLYDRVIVKRLDEEQRTAGGIVIPDTAKEKPVQGLVVAIGTGKLLENGDIRALAVKVGDKVLFGKYSGTEIKLDNEELLVMREEDLMGIVEA